jgi:tRNA (uracil-5-)-methyltransferase TRM9
MATNREIFNEIAESWYRLRHWCRFTDELNELAQRWKEGKLLNIGCAHGPDFLPFRNKFGLWGIDFSDRMLTMAQKYADKFQLDVNLAVADAICLPFDNCVFDYAIAVATYHHVPGEKQRKGAFLELRRVLKPDAEAFITVWNKWQPRFWLSNKEAYVGWKSKDKTYYRYHYLYSYSELRKSLIEAGFIIISMMPEKSYRFPVKVFSRNICTLVKAP